jgi:hypothetical protein
MPFQFISCFFSCVSIPFLENADILFMLITGFDKLGLVALDNPFLDIAVEHLPDCFNKLVPHCLAPMRSYSKCSLGISTDRGVFASAAWVQL